MTKYYFISYFGTNKDGQLYGHCTMEVKNLNLYGIKQRIASGNDLIGMPIILCLKDLSKREYKMLSRKEE